MLGIPHCAAPTSGQGTSLALVGAYVLARELVRTADHALALARYESRMRPFVEANQELAFIDRQTVNPEESTRRIDAVKDLIDLDAVADQGRIGRAPIVGGLPHSWRV